MVLIDVFVEKQSCTLTYICIFGSMSDAGPHVFYLYLVTPLGAPRSYIMKLPAMLQSTCFMDGLCEVQQPVDLYTFSTISIACITFTTKTLLTTTVVLSYLHAISEWFQTMATHSRHIPVHLSPNVDTIICSFSPLFDPVNLVWTLDLPVCEPSLTVFRQKVFFAWCGFMAHASTEGAEPLAVTLYRDTCSSATHDLRSRLPTLRRVHRQSQQPLNRPPDISDPSHMLEYEYNFNYNYFDEEFLPSLELLDSMVGIMEDPLIMDVEQDTLINTGQAGTSTNTLVLTEGVIMQGNSIIYMCPVSTQFVQARVTRITPSSCWFECEPPPLQPFDGATLVSLYDPTTQSLFGKLQALSLYTIVK